MANKPERARVMIRRNRGTPPSRPRSRILFSGRCVWRPYSSGLSRVICRTGSGQRRISGRPIAVLLARGKPLIFDGCFVTLRALFSVRATPLLVCSQILTLTTFAKFFCVSGVGGRRWELRYTSRVRVVWKTA